MNEEIAAWRARFPMYEYRFQDDCIALKLEQPKFGCHCEMDDYQTADDCVIGTDKEDDCTYALNLVLNHKCKTDCKYWLPVKMHENA